MGKNISELLGQPNTLCQYKILVEELSPKKQILNYLQMKNIPERTYNFKFHISSNK